MRRHNTCEIPNRWTEAVNAAGNSRDVASPHYIPLKHFEPIGGSVNLSVIRLKQSELHATFDKNAAFCFSAAHWDCFPSSKSNHN